MPALERLPQQYIEYLLCRFIRDAGEVQGRIRVQKAVFLVGAEKVPLFTDFFYHLRGPYSPGLARALGRLVDQGLIDERPEPIGPDPETVQYRYRLSEDGGKVLEWFGSRPVVHGAVQLGDDCTPAFVRLVARKVPELELAATLVYWKQQGYEWDQAVEITADLKKSARESAQFNNALALAKRTLT